MANHSRPQLFYFDYDLERDGDTMSIEVGYCFADDEVYLDSVRFSNEEIDTSDAEDKELLAHAYECLGEDLSSAGADYGDYLRDMRRESED